MKKSWRALQHELEAVYAVQREAARAKRAAENDALAAERAKKEQWTALRTQRFTCWVQQARRIPFKAGDDWQTLVFEGPYVTDWGDGLEGPTPAGPCYPALFGADRVSWEKCGSLYGPRGRFIIYLQYSDRTDRRASLADLQTDRISPRRFGSAYTGPLGPHLRQRDAEIREWAIATLETAVQRADVKIAALEHALNHEGDPLALLALESEANDE